MTSMAEHSRDIAKLASDLSHGISAVSVLIEQQQKQLNELTTKFDARVRDEHSAEVRIAGELATLKSNLLTLQGNISTLMAMAERIAKLEAGQEHVLSDITGKHDLVKVIHESSEKKEDRRLEEEKVRADERKARLQFWGTVAVVALPGIIALLWNLLGLPGQPPGRTQDRVEASSR